MLKECLCNYIESLVYLTSINRKGPMPQNIKVQFINLIQMQIYHLQDFIGEFNRNSTSPNTFTAPLIDTSIILRVRTNPQPHQTKYYLVYRKGKGKAHYLSALWNSSNTAKNGINEYVITDTQGLKGFVEIDMFTLRIKKA
jgi:hypothetical protein